MAGFRGEIVGTVFDALHVGNGANTDKYYYADIPGANKPCLRYNHTTAVWELSNDGAAFAIIVSGAPSAVLKVAYAKFVVATDGGTDTITPAINTLIPDNAIIIGVTLNSTTALAPTGLKVSCGTSAGSSTTALLAATPTASWTTDAILLGIPTRAAPIKLTAAGQVTFTISV